MLGSNKSIDIDTKRTGFYWPRVGGKNDKGILVSKAIVEAWKTIAIKKPF